jgi:hypothetical protein
MTKFYGLSIEYPNSYPNTPYSYNNIFTDRGELQAVKFPVFAENSSKIESCEFSRLLYFLTIEFLLLFILKISLFFSLFI